MADYRVQVTRVETDNSETCLYSALFFHYEEVPEVLKDIKALELDLTLASECEQCRPFEGYANAKGEGV